MRLIERYLFRQLLTPTLLATAALGAVGLLSQSLGQLDIIIEQRQTAWVFVQVIVLAMPQLMNLILPIAIFVAALVGLNRLQADHELVVCQAAGMTRWRVISPALRLAVLAVLIGLFVNLFVQPASYRAMREIVFAAKTDLAATLVRKGEFTQPASNLTVYGQDVAPDGRISNLFIHQRNENGGATTYTAREGRITYRDGQPVLVMHDGSNQEFSRAGVLNYLSFQEYALELAPFLDTGDTITYKASDRYLHELFFPDLNKDWERKNRDKLLAEGHSRIASPLYSLTFMVMALAAVLGGSFSRLGYGKRIAAIGAGAAVVRIIGFAVQAACEDTPALNVLQYVIPLLATAWAFGQLYRPVRRRPGLREWLPYGIAETEKKAVAA
ncbi:LPS export ABC transporter permease LptF [Caulobacter mirabilis]|uniref:LPS export ABC transporter permease LptF n=1 Tax=Caulobacter mirabilis TaxID=69666 RepID=A0A2D2AZ32_9CAUL|nr:LPS export ABC transporter permease LptF [Caulobacter mirabilis]ATQ43242.1 LPS export ABC transporter permease LptF [Caulobacter mirabilis]